MAPFQIFVLVRGIFLGQNHVIRTFFDMAIHETELIPKGLTCNHGLLDINFVIQGP
jgi:hypothetical protein